MALYSPSRFSRPRSGPLLPNDRRWPSVHSVPPPVGSFAPATLPVRGIHFPTRSVPPGLPCGSHRWRAPVVSSRLTSWRFTLPRRGLPHPLRSAYAVSHDLDGLPLLGPCEVFRPLTSMGFGPGSLLQAPVGWPEDQPSRCVSGRTSPKFVPVGPRGRVVVQEAPGRLRAEQLPKHPSELRRHRSVRSRSATEVTLPSRMVRFRLPCKAPCLLRVLTTEAAIRPDCRSPPASIRR